MSELKYKAHIAETGWMDDVNDGVIAGSVGAGIALEGIMITGLPEGVMVVGDAHVQDIGWIENVVPLETIGTTGQGKHLEAIRLRLQGPNADKYDIWYRLHVQDRGWLDWVRNNEFSGTVGGNVQAEAVQIMLRDRSEHFTPKSDKPYGFEDLTAYTQSLREAAEAAKRAAEEQAKNAGGQGLINVARSQLGYVSGTSSDSYFGRIYVGAGAGDWCCFFTRWCCEQAGVDFYPTGYCPYVVDWAKSMGKWTMTPKPGYIVLFDFTPTGGNGIADHIGIVEEVISGGVIAIEGNTGSPVGVYRRTRTSGILGYVKTY